jgi:hypothetical protein
VSVTTYEEWRVTGTCDGESVDIVWSPSNAAEPEADARAYARAQVYASQMRKQGTGWSDGPHLHKRTVTDWEAIA